MTDADLETLYKVNLPTSHAAALRGVFDAGYEVGAGATVNAQTADASLTVSESTAAADIPQESAATV